jgi:high-affinity nickel-transport protein
MFPALMTAMLLGLRHGYDIDHVAAISDLSATGSGGLRAFRLSTVYAIGHAAVLLAFGVAAVSFGLVVPEAVDGLMGRVIGITLIGLALYVVIGFVRFGRTWLPRSRGSLIWRAAHRRLHRHDIGHDPSTVGAFVIGMIHGIGAETPTQLLLLPAAAEFGFAVVVAFVGGLLLTNTILAAASAWGLMRIRGSLAFGALSIATAAFSAVVGWGYMIG